MKIFKKKTSRLIRCLALVLLCTLLFTGCSGTAKPAQQPIGACSVLATSTYLPEAGEILSAHVDLYEGDSAWDVLSRAAKEANVNVTVTGSGKSVYIVGIGDLIEKEHGDASGWMYTVNGEFLSESCGTYLPADGDALVWDFYAEP